MQGQLFYRGLNELYYGAADPKGGCAGTLMNLLQDERFNHQSEVVSGVLEEECGRTVNRLFSKDSRRKKEEKGKKKLIMENTKLQWIKHCFFKKKLYTKYASDKAH